MSAEIVPTICCAIGILRATNETTPQEIVDQITKVTEEQAKNWLGTPPGKGQTLLLAVTTPTESALAKKLYAAGFNVMLPDLRRRTGYPAGDLILWSIRIR